MSQDLLLTDDACGKSHTCCELASDKPFHSRAGLECHKDEWENSARILRLSFSPGIIVYAPQKPLVLTVFVFPCSLQLRFLYFLGVNASLFLFQNFSFCFFLTLLLILCSLHLPHTIIRSSKPQTPFKTLASLLSVPWWSLEAARLEGISRASKE